MPCNFKPNNIDLLHYIRFTRNYQTIMNKLFFIKIINLPIKFSSKDSTLPTGKGTMVHTGWEARRTHKIV